MEEIWAHPFFNVSWFCLPFLGVSDVDECGQDNVCLRGQCLNTDGSFLCLCEAGFKYNDEAADCEGKTKLWCLLIYCTSETTDPTNPEVRVLLLSKPPCQHWQFGVSVALLAMADLLKGFRLGLEPLLHSPSTKGA